MEERNDFFSQYLEYASKTEVPIQFHRWSAIGLIAAFLGRQFYLKHGHSNVYPNMYTMLIGNPGTRKSTAIKLAKKILVQAGYTTIAASKTTKEKFLMDLARIGISGEGEDILERNLFGGNDEPAETFIMADEFNTFFGNNILEFVSELGTLWDWDGPYENRIKNGQSYIINNPTINILGGNTPVSFNTAFPSEILGQGFFSRLILVYGEPNGRKIAFPIAPSDEDTTALIKSLIVIRKHAAGVAKISAPGLLLLEKIYNSWTGVDDVRFESYSNRRFPHLLKMCMIHAAARCSAEINESDIVYANTVLTACEHNMPKALGEFGKARNSDVAQKIISVLDATSRPMRVKEIYKHVANDVEKFVDMTHIMNNLLAADKIQSTPDGFLPKKRIETPKYNGVIHSGFLTAEERREE